MIIFNLYLTALFSHGSTVFILFTHPCIFGLKIYTDVTNLLGLFSVDIYTKMDLNYYLYGYIGRLHTNSCSQERSKNKELRLYLRSPFSSCNHQPNCQNIITSFCIQRCGMSLFGAFLYPKEVQPLPVKIFFPDNLITSSGGNGFEVRKSS